MSEFDQVLDRVISLINQVKRCIEYSIEHNITKQATMLAIVTILKIPAAITQSVWEMLEQQNPQMHPHPMCQLLPSDADIDNLPLLMEICFAGDKTMHETMIELFTELHIPPPFTQIVWEMLEEGCPVFFQGYYTRLELERQCPVSGLFPSEDVIDLVPIHIDCCIQYNMTMQKTMDDIFIHLNISPAFTQIVWNVIERDNPEIFQDYYARMELMRQQQNVDLLEEAIELNIRPDFTELVQHILTYGQIGATGETNQAEEMLGRVQKRMENMTLNDAPSGSGGVEQKQKQPQMMWTPPAGEEARSEEKDLFDDGDDEFEEFDINHDEEEAGQEITQPWEDEWDDDDDDDDDDDFSQLLRNLRIGQV